MKTFYLSKRKKEKNWKFQMSFVFGHTHLSDHISINHIDMEHKKPFLSY